MVNVKSSRFAQSSELIFPTKVSSYFFANFTCSPAKNEWSDGLSLWSGRTAWVYGVVGRLESMEWSDGLSEWRLFDIQHCAQTTNNAHQTKHWTLCLIEASICWVQTSKYYLQPLQPTKYIFLRQLIIFSSICNLHLINPPFRKS